MKYFQSVVDFVENNFIWVIIAFFLALAIETLILFLRRKTDGFQTNKLYVLAITDLLAIIGIYVLACLVVGFVNCVKDQNWHFFKNYSNFLGKYGIPIYVIGCIIGAIIGIVIAVKGGEETGVIVIAGIGGALGGFIAIVILGFIVYVLVSIIIIIFKVLWFVISGFFISLFSICANHKLELLICVCAPGMIYGCACALINYISSLKEEVFERY